MTGKTIIEPLTHLLTKRFYLWSIALLCASLFAMVLLQSCASSRRFSSASRVQHTTSAQHITDTTATRVRSGDVVVGFASYYGDEFQGRTTSSGEVFDQAQLTAAHRSFPFGTVVRVTN